MKYIMEKPLLLTLLMFIALHPGSVSCWDSEELDLFDLVEEVGTNFYELMGIEASASTSDVRRAYKKLALQLHPDKNPSPTAEVEFRQLAAVYEVLKDKERREMYDRVLVEGLPNWKTPVFYFRRMRKIGLAEGLAYLLTITTVIQYFVNYAAFWERGFTIHENLSQEVKRRQKRMRKEGKTEEDIEKEIKEVEAGMLGERPTVFDTLPFQLYRGCKSLVFAIPQLPSLVKEMWEEKQREKREREEEERLQEEERRRKEEEKEKRKEFKAKRKNAKQYREATDDPENCLLVSPEGPEEEAPQVTKLPRNANQMWTDADLIELARLIKKLPGGSADRWERIAEVLERTAPEVTKMAANIKKNPGLVPVSSSSQGVTGEQGEHSTRVADECLETHVQEDSYDSEGSSTESDEVDEDGYLVLQPQKVEEYVAPQEKKKAKTKGGKMGIQEGEEVLEEEIWSQEQQKALEQALVAFPKGTNERWDRIATKVAGKTKEQCMARFRELAEQIKKKKTEQAS